MCFDGLFVIFCGMSLHFVYGSNLHLERFPKLNVLFFESCRLLKCLRKRRKCSLKKWEQKLKRPKSSQGGRTKGVGC